MNRAVALGAVCSALAAVAGMYLGGSFGLLVPLAAAVAGGAVLGLFAGRVSGGSRSEPAASCDAAAAMTAAAAEAAETANASAQEPVESAPAVPQGPAETHEVQLKLDLARSYLEMEEVGLAIPLLQEILETELAVAARLGSDALRETR